MEAFHIIEYVDHLEDAATLVPEMVSRPADDLDVAELIKWVGFPWREDWCGHEYRQYNRFLLARRSREEV